jgi:hypothetical protein
MKSYEITKDSDGHLVVRMTADFARDVASAIDEGIDLRAEWARDLNALSDSIHEMVGDASTPKA